MTNEEKQAAQDEIDIIQRSAFKLNAMGADVTDLISETRELNRWLVIEGAEGHEIFDIEPSISIHSGAAQ
jgi:adenylosuccinate synthase